MSPDQQAHDTVEFVSWAISEKMAKKRDIWCQKINIQEPFFLHFPTFWSPKVRWRPVRISWFFYLLSTKNQYLPFFLRLPILVLIMTPNQHECHWYLNLNMFPGGNSSTLVCLGPDFPSEDPTRVPEIPPAWVPFLCVRIPVHLLYFYFWHPTKVLWNYFVSTLRLDPSRWTDYL